MKRLLFTTVFSAILLLLSSASAYATGNQTPPQFPSCQDQTEDGDWASYDQGTHYVIGDSNNPYYGADDVYSLDNGNFIQCLCPDNSDIGIQTNWWKIGDSLSEENLNHYQNNGWIIANGANWNLYHSTYLAKNVNYTCREPKPTATPTPSPTPKPTATPVPTQKPTPVPSSEPDNHRSECVLLSANTYGGTAPLTVEFKANGDDTNGYVEAYKFDFGTEIITTEHNTATHRFDNPGNFNVKLFVKDSRGVWKGHKEKCEVNINVLSKPQVLGASDTDKLPETGINYFALGFLVTGAAGVSLYLKLR